MFAAIASSNVFFLPSVFPTCQISHKNIKEKGHIPVAVHTNNAANMKPQTLPSLTCTPPDCIPKLKLAKKKTKMLSLFPLLLAWFLFQ